MKFSLSSRLVRYQRGATLVEFSIMGSMMLLVMMLLIQYGLMYHAKSQVNYAAFEAARAGTTDSARPATIRTAFTRAMTGYYGGGTSTAELAKSYGEALKDINTGGPSATPAVRIEVLSPTKESFDDFNSPELAAKMGGGKRVIPNSNLAFIKCPVDVPGCSANAHSNTSGQTLIDANLLKLRITYGIPKPKQVPLAGRFVTYWLGQFNKADTDAFRMSLIQAGRIPVVVHTVMRMQSPAIEDGNASSPGPGNEGKPVDPGPLPPGPEVPSCPPGNPVCAPPPCDPATDPSCKPVDPPCGK